MGENPAPELHAIRQQLRRLLESPAFRRSRQLRALLSRGVEHAMGDGEAPLKEHTLGVEVFGRPADYDPRIDPIVRVQANNLRNRLRDHYRADGIRDSILIELPPGSYVPLFSLRSDSPDEPALDSSPPALGIAVLAFENLSGDPDQEYLSDGVSEELITILSRIRGLRVVARTSSFVFKGNRAAIDEIGQALGVRFILEGSIRSAEGRIRVNAQLVDSEGGFSVWSDSWDRRFEDAFAVQTEVAAAIVRELHVKLSREEADRLSQPGTENADSYDVYLRGWKSLHEWTDEGLNLAVRQFKRAIELDRRNAPAHAGLSWAYAALANNALASPQEVEFPARTHANEAIRISPSLGEAHSALGIVRTVFDLDWEGAEAAFNEAIRLSPSFSMGYHALAVTVLLNVRRFDEAITAISRARELDPVSIHALGEMGFVYTICGRHQDAVQTLTPAVSLHPDVWFLHEYRALAFKGLERLEDAWADAERALELHPCQEIIALAGHMAALSGRRARAMELRGKLEELGRKGYVSLSVVAILEGGLGNLDHGFDLLDQALREREPPLRYLSAGFGFEAFWGHERFEALRRELKLPDPLSPADLVEA